MKSTQEWGRTIAQLRLSSIQTLHCNSDSDTTHINLNLATGLVS